MGQDWEPLDAERAIKRAREQREQTTSANAGGFVGPAFGPSVFRREPLPSVRPPAPRKRKKKIAD